MSRFRWPWESLGAAYQQWQAQESRWPAAQQWLARDYQALLRQAERAQLASDQGVLRAARLRLEQPLDPVILTARERLARVFARLGRSFYSGVPSPLAAELAQYAAGMERSCRSLGELGARLRLAQAMMMVLSRQPEFCTPHYFHLALTAPESAWLLFHLRQQRLEQSEE
jgi:hypothetical protein